jgi:lipopolysaccharide export system permease protein
MTLIDRYLMRTVLLHTLMVLAVLLALMALVNFISHQDDIGQGTFDVAGAFFVTILSLPQQAYEMLPIAALIGAVIGLGGLARDSELTIIRAAGVSVARIAGSTALAGLVIAGLLWVIGEYFAPPADQYARQYKIFSRYSQLEFAGRSSAWVRQGTWFINVRQQAAENLFGGVFVYELDSERRLRLVGRAETAAQDAQGRWVLSNYGETLLAGDGVAARRSAREVSKTEFNADFLGLAVNEPASLPLRDLYTYKEHLEANDQDARPWEIAFWARIARLVAAVVVCVFAVPFAFGPLRSAGAGSRTVLGIMAGVLYMLLTQTLENSGQVYGINPLVVAWGPPLLLALVATVAIWRSS